MREKQISAQVARRGVGHALKKGRRAAELALYILEDGVFMQFVPPFLASVVGSVVWLLVGARAELLRTRLIMYLSLVLCLLWRFRSSRVVLLWSPVVMMVLVSWYSWCPGRSALLW